jgi:hypothetical protein
MCLRPWCGKCDYGSPSQPEAFAEALAHARKFVPQPPEPGLFPELTWEAYMTLASGVPVVSEAMPFAAVGAEL